jgi:ribosomal protein S18 acetylase RimI-like enzyme
MPAPAARRAHCGRDSGTKPLALDLANRGDAEALYLLRRQLEDWLADKGVDLWPQGHVGHEVIAAQIRSGQWHLLRDPIAGLAAALRLLRSDPDFWDDDRVPAVYVHGLMVDRRVAGRGLGPALLGWAAARGLEEGARLFRLDCAESNRALRAFYRSQGFHEVGRREFRGLFSVTLFEKTL